MAAVTGDNDGDSCWKAEAGKVAATATAAPVTAEDVAAPVAAEDVAVPRFRFWKSQGLSGGDRYNAVQVVACGGEK